MTTYDVRHATVYEYDSPAVTSHNEAHLLPRRLDWQRVGRVELRIDPSPDQVQWHSDYFGNDVVYFTLHQPHERLVIRTDSVVELRPPPALEAEASMPWEAVAARVRTERDDASLDAFEFVFDSPFVKTDATLAAFARESFPEGRPIAVGILDLMHRIYRDFEYTPGATTLDTPLSEVLEQRRGVCQDFAHLMIGGLRSLGLPARYVSGYLRTSTRPPEPAPRSPERADAGERDASQTTKEEDALVGSEASHAWVSAWSPELGWFDVDPTNDLVPSDRHVTLAWGRDYDDVSPVKGVTLGGGFHTVEVSVEVREREDVGTDTEASDRPAT